jgi:hypothetical protein
VVDRRYRAAAWSALKVSPNSRTMHYVIHPCGKPRRRHNQCGSPLEREYAKSAP